MFFWLHCFAVSGKVKIPYTGLTTPVGWISLPQWTVLSRSAIVVKLKFLVALLCCHVVFCYFSVGEGAFVIELSQISFVSLIYGYFDIYFMVWETFWQIDSIIFYQLELNLYDNPTGRSALQLNCALGKCIDRILGWQLQIWKRSNDEIQRNCWMSIFI